MKEGTSAASQDELSDAEQPRNDDLLRWPDAQLAELDSLLTRQVTLTSSDRLEHSLYHDADEARR